MKSQKKERGGYVKKTFPVMAVLLVSLCLLTACGDGGKTTESGKSVSDSAVDLSYMDDSGNLVIPQEAISEEALLAGYKYDDTVMEIIAVKDSDGDLHFALNTCQVCSGSSKAYYVQDGDSFICQNCGNVFETAQIGTERDGCNPIPLDDVDTEDGEVTITQDVLKEYTAYFTNWKGLNV